MFFDAILTTEVIKHLTKFINWIKLTNKKGKEQLIFCDVLHLQAELIWLLCDPKISCTKIRAVIIQVAKIYYNKTAFLSSLCARRAKEVLFDCSHSEEWKRIYAVRVKLKNITYAKGLKEREICLAVHQQSDIVLSRIRMSTSWINLFGMKSRLLELQYQYSMSGILCSFVHEQLDTKDWNIF